MTTSVASELRNAKENDHTKSREITDDDIIRMKARIGIEVPELDPWNEYATENAIRHYAEGIGDDNPLFRNASYARTTRWGGIIAPPYFLETMGVSRITEIPAHLKEAGKGALGGIHSWYSGDTLNFYLPVHEGDRLWVKRYTSDVMVKPSEFAGRTVQAIRTQEYVNQRGELVAAIERFFVAGGREKKPGERRKYAHLEMQHWEPDQIEEIAAEYRNEKRRGAEPRYWEDVEIGESLPRRIKGPLTVSDMIRFLMSGGSPTLRAHKFAYAFRDKHPGAYPIDEKLGIPDVVERVHWDEDFARKTGNPAVYDYGVQRVAWLCQLMTDWIGDDGFLRTLHIDLRQFNYVSDVTYLYGVVEEKLERDGQYLVRCKIWGQDQRNRRTCEGWAEAALPSRQYGPVKLAVLPAPPIKAPVTEG